MRAARITPAEQDAPHSDNHAGRRQMHCPSGAPPRAAVYVAAYSWPHRCAAGLCHWPTAPLMCFNGQISAAYRVIGRLALVDVGHAALCDRCENPVFDRSMYGRKGGSGKRAVPPARFRATSKSLAITSSSRLWVRSLISSFDPTQGDALDEGLLREEEQDQ